MKSPDFIDKQLEEKTEVTDQNLNDKEKFDSTEVHQRLARSSLLGEKTNKNLLSSTESNHILQY